MSDSESSIPPGFCHCGCGQRTAPATRNRPRNGLIKGQPTRYLPGHQPRTRKHFIPEPNPSGLCMCGCGNPTPLASMTDEEAGLVAGKPTRYITGHQTKKSPVDYVVDPETDCWIWQGAKANAYGVGTAPDHSSTGAHRLAYEAAHGPIPPGHMVCHTCDNPPCVNPDHLFAGTASDNRWDCVKKGRHKTGRKLTALEVDAVRSACAAGETQSSVARRYGVHRATICLLLAGRTYKANR